MVVHLPKERFQQDFVSAAISAPLSASRKKWTEALRLQQKNRISKYWLCNFSRSAFEKSVYLLPSLPLCQLATMKQTKAKRLQQRDSFCQCQRSQWPLFLTSTGQVSLSRYACSKSAQVLQSMSHFLKQTRGPRTAAERHL